MKNMSFSMTTEQYREGSKTVTRRLGWAFLKTGDVFMGVVKGMGLKKGEKIKRIHPSKVISNRSEPIYVITQDDVIKEGFPDWSTEQFIEFFCKGNRCACYESVNRIEFEHLLNTPAASLDLAITDLKKDIENG